jgi:predicted SAM-dependent methyltransferase
MAILNLGAGKKIVPEAVNVDRLWLPGIDWAQDLSVLPWEFQDGAFDKVLAFAIFEHLTIDLVEVMDECWRVLKPNGLLRVKVPHWQSEQAHNGIHRWQYNEHAFDLFDPATRNGRVYDYYTHRKWVLEDCKRKAGSIYANLRKVVHG